MFKFIKYLVFYIKHNRDINNLYGYNLKQGWATDETANWFERTDYYKKAI